MANYQCSFTTTGANEDILQNSAIKPRIMERLGATDDAQYASFFSGSNPSGITMKFDIIFTATNKVSLNNGIYNDLIEDMAYSSGGYTKLTSLKVQTAGSGILVFSIR